MEKLRGYILFFAFITLAIGCSGFPINQKDEPAIIVIRNSSETHIEEVSIRWVKKQSQYVHVGAISPVPVGVSQVIRRPTNPPRLPEKAIICWMPSGAQKEICKQKEVRVILKNSAGAKDSLVFEIMKQSNVNIYLEKTP